MQHAERNPRARIPQSHRVVVAARGEHDAHGPALVPLGIVAGQASRQVSVEIAVRRAGDRAKLAVLASDAYFPFPDGFEILAQAGVRAVAEPGGSIRDHLVIAAAEAAGIPLYFTGVRHFYH